MSEPKRILVTGAAGKVGQTFIRRFLAERSFDGFIVRALCHHREIAPHPRIEMCTVPSKTARP